jgi:hypothetical protein
LVVHRIWGRFGEGKRTDDTWVLFIPWRYNGREAAVDFVSFILYIYPIHLYLVWIGTGFCAWTRASRKVAGGQGKKRDQGKGSMCFLDLLNDVAMHGAAGLREEVIPKSGHLQLPFGTL